MQCHGSNDYPARPNRTVSVLCPPVGCGAKPPRTGWIPRAGIRQRSAISASAGLDALRCRIGNSPPIRRPYANRPSSKDNSPKNQRSHLSLDCAKPLHLVWPTTDLYDTNTRAKVPLFIINQYSPRWKTEGLLLKKAHWLPAC